MPGSRASRSGSSGSERLRGVKVPKSRPKFAGWVRGGLRRHLIHALIEFPEILLSDQSIGAACCRTSEPGGDWFAKRLDQHYGFADARGWISRFPMTSRHANGHVWRAGTWFQSARNGLDQGRGHLVQPVGFGTECAKSGNVRPFWGVPVRSHNARD